MPVKLKDYQRDALLKMHNGCILNGSVGSGKSITSLAYFFNVVCRGQCEKPYHDMRYPMDLYIITTAKKRDELDWEKELLPFYLSPNPKYCRSNIKITIDSWNNIRKYIHITSSFFIFDEDHITGKGAWAKDFIHIARYNKWIVLSATPGDTWQDYATVFVANGYFKNRTDFNNQHIVFNPFVKFPVVQQYLGVNTLVRLRNMTLVQMDYKNPHIPVHYWLHCDYDMMLYHDVVQSRKSPFKLDEKGNEEPIINASEYCYTLRKIVNKDPSRIQQIDTIFEGHKKLIIFYNFDYELEILKRYCTENEIVFSEWNGHNHEPVPKTESWIYLVNYGAGAEGWNCIETDTILFYSLNYSYKTMVQSCGRIDRMTSPFIKLYYYHLYSESKIDVAIRRANSYKKNFNEGKFLYGKTKGKDFFTPARINSEEAVL